MPDLNLTPEQQSALDAALAAPRGGPVCVHGPPKSGRTTLLVALQRAFAARSLQAVVVTSNKTRKATLERSYPMLPVTTAYAFGLGLLRAAGFHADVDESKTERLAKASRARQAKEPWFPRRVESAAVGHGEMPQGGEAIVKASVDREELTRGISFMDMVVAPIELDLAAQVQLPDVLLVDDLPSACPMFATQLRRLADRPPPRRRPFIVATVDTCADREGSNAAILRGDTDAPAQDVLLRTTHLAGRKQLEYAQECVGNADGPLAHVGLATPRQGFVQHRGLTGAHVARGAFVVLHAGDVVAVARRGGRLRYGPAIAAWIAQQKRIEFGAALRGGPARNKPYVTPTLELVEVRKGSAETGWLVLTEDEVGGAGAPCVLLQQDYTQDRQRGRLCARYALAASETLALEA